MKLILLVVDAARLDAVRADLAGLGASGYTAIPVSEGAGRTGLHTGDRVHPGALEVVLVVESDERASHLFDEMVRRSAAAMDRTSRFFLLPVERQA